MGGTMNPADVRKMSTAERIQAMEALWESLEHDGVDIETPEWHRHILTERKEKLNRGTARFVSLADLKALHSK
jgi:hypothetical protein